MTKLPKLRLPSLSLATGGAFKKELPLGEESSLFNRKEMTTDLFVTYRYQGEISPGAILLLKVQCDLQPTRPYNGGIGIYP